MQLGVIDIGGTSIKYGVVNSDGTLTSHYSIPTDALKGGKALMEKVFKICDTLMEQYTLEGIAISSAGQIDHRNGVVVFATDNIPDYTGTPVADLVASHTGLPAAVDNDVNCMALGEYWQGAAKGFQNFICLTLGTGIGGALFLNGKLYTGARFSAGEIGHMCLYPNGKPCTCGSKGCYEQYASSSALAELVKTELGLTLDLKEFFTKIKQGEKEAVVIFEHWVNDLTTGLQSLAHIFNPELILIGGGISAQGDFLVDAVQSSLYKKLMPNHRKSLEVKLALQSNQANLLGAAKHFLMMHENSNN